MCNGEVKEVPYRCILWPFNEDLSTAGYYRRGLLIILLTVYWALYLCPNESMCIGKLQRECIIVTVEIITYAFALKLILILVLTN